MLGSRFVLWVSLLLVLSFTGLSHARVIIIPDDEETIQAGIDAAEEGDTVLVNPDEYRESINFDGKAITVGSLYLTTRNRIYVDSTVIKDQIIAVMFNHREGANSRFTGFTIHSDPNRYPDWLGAIDIGNSSPSIEYVVVRGTRGAHVCGIFCHGESNPVISYATIFDNSSGCWCGGGIKCYDNSSPILVNCIVAFNGTEYNGCYGLNVHGGQPVLINCILWGNINRQIITYDTLTLINCDIEHGLDSIRIAENGHVIWDDSDISEDPLFVDSDEFNFQLTENSPCIDTGDPESDLDPDGTRADMGAFYFHQRDIDVDPDTLEFIGVQTGTVDTLSILIQNVGLTPLQISAQTIEPEEAPFTIVTGGSEVEIEPESDHLTWISFSPEEQAEYRAVLRIESDDPDEEIVEIPLIGTALSIDGEDNQPLEFCISGVYPNPFNSRTTIHYEVPQPSQVSLSVYDLVGRLVERLVDDRVDAGRYAETWQAGILSSGLYFVRFEAGDRMQMQKVVLIR